MGLLQRALHSGQSGHGLLKTALLLRQSASEPVKKKS